jgi:hypothetical protein
MERKFKLIFSDKNICFGYLDIRNSDLKNQTIVVLIDVEFWLDHTRDLFGTDINLSARIYYLEQP